MMICFIINFHYILEISSHSENRSLKEKQLWNPESQ